MGKAKVRLDQLMLDQGLADSHDRARRLIMAGAVLVDDQPMDKPGHTVPRDATLRLRTRFQPSPYVSRAGEKLASALEGFHINVNHCVALDLGASTGGFTDCLLQRGAERVYAVDVGTNQLAYRLRQDSRVICLERTHAKQLNKNLIPEPINILTVDVSFTSLRYVLPHVLPLLQQDAQCICLFKPQFEVNRDQVGVGGIVDEMIGAAALAQSEPWFAEQGLILRKKIKSPVKGREGNQEYLLWFSR